MDNSRDSAYSIVMSDLVQEEIILVIRFVTDRLQRFVELIKPIETISPTNLCGRSVTNIITV